MSFRPCQVLTAMLSLLLREQASTIGQFIQPFQVNNIQAKCLNIEKTQKQFTQQQI